MLDPLVSQTLITDGVSKASSWEQLARNGASLDTAESCSQINLWPDPGRRREAAKPITVRDQGLTKVYLKTRSVQWTSPA